MNVSTATVIDRFPAVKVLVLGDAMLDRYLVGETRRICREAPVPVLNVASRLSFAGGAANVALNAAGLGAEVTFISLVGNDDNGRRLAALLNESRVRTEAITDNARRTTCKTRFVTDAQIVFRADDACTEEITERQEKELLRRVEQRLFEVDLLIVSDYGCGLLKDSTIAALSALRRSFLGTVVVDSRKRLTKLAALSPTAVKPNYLEALELLHAPAEDVTERIGFIAGAGEQILSSCNTGIAAVTLDRDGALLFERGKEPHRTFSVPMRNYKASGAGDTYTGALALCLACAAPPNLAAEIAAAAAAVVMAKEHTGTCSHNELRSQLCGQGKVLNSLEAARIRAELYRSEGRTIVLTTGCFDHLHRGSLSTLLRAKELGSVLFVALNSDEGVRALKGPERPIHSLEDRVKVLEALSAVDHVVPFEGIDALPMVEAIRPRIFAKGGTYCEEGLPEASAVKAYGGKVVILPYLPDVSTTGMIDRIRRLPPSAPVGRHPMHSSSSENGDLERH